MNLVLVFLFNLLLFKNCLSATLDGGSLRNDIQQQNQLENDTQDDTLLDDFMYPVFDLAELEDLVQMAKKPESAELVKNIIFPAKYRNYHFVYAGEDQQIVVSMTPSSIYIRSLKLFMDVITNFGKYLKTMGIYGRDDLNADNLATLNECISEHCSDSLEFLSFGYIQEHTFNHYTKPLENLKELVFEVKTDEIGSILPFDVIYPNLEILHIKYHGTINNNNGVRFIDSELPVIKNLKQLNIFVDVSNRTNIAKIQRQIGIILQ